MSGLDLIECKHCDWTIATDLIVFNFTENRLNDEGRTAILSMTKHLTQKHPLKKYLALRNMKLKYKIQTLKLFKEIKKGYINGL